MKKSAAGDKATKNITVWDCPTKDIKAYPKNPRTHSPEQIARISASIQNFGFTNPVLLDEENQLICGHGRLMAAREMGLDTVPAITARGWSEAEKKAYVIADNQLALQAGWDEDILRAEIASLRLLDFEIDLLGFDAKELLSIETFGMLRRPVGSLSEQFIYPPFSVLDAKGAWWQARKRAWLSLGIQSELGRGENALGFSETVNEKMQPRRKRRNQR